MSAQGVVEMYAVIMITNCAKMRFQLQLRNVHWVWLGFTAVLGLYLPGVYQALKWPSGQPLLGVNEPVFPLCRLGSLVFSLVATAF